MMNEQQLLNLKHQVEEAKDKAAELKGQQKSLMARLDKDWGCKTVAQAEKKAKEIQTEIDQLNDQINKGVEELEEKYELS